MRKSTIVCALAGASGLMWGGVAHAVSIVNDNFDGYANQAAFQAAWPAVGSDVTAPSGLLSTVQKVSSPNAIQIPGTAANNQYRNRRTFAETTGVSLTQQIEWSFDFYDSAPTAAPQRNFCNLQDTTAPTGTNQLVAMGFNNNQTGANSGGQFYMARILGYTVPTTADPEGGPNESVGGAGAFFKLNDYGVGARSLGWHTLKVILSTDDGLSTDYAFYVDGFLAERVNNVGSAASIRSFDNIALGSGLSNGSTTAYVDNMKLDVTPEPATLVLLAGGSIGLMLRRRSRVA